jgi:hypothetical protein
MSACLATEEVLVDRTVGSPRASRSRHRRAREAVELRDDKRIGTSPRKLFERGTDTRTLQVLGTETGVFDDLNDLPAGPDDWI